MQLIIKKLFIILTFIITFVLNQSNSFAFKENSFDDFGIISIMYHRFNENKYPSTNIEMDIFRKQLEIIENEGIKFVHPKNLSRTSLRKNWKEKFFYCRRWIAIFL